MVPIKSNTGKRESGCAFQVNKRVARIKSSSNDAGNHSTSEQYKAARAKAKIGTKRLLRAHGGYGAGGWKMESG